MKHLKQIVFSLLLLLGSSANSAEFLGFLDLTTPSYRFDVVDQKRFQLPPKVPVVLPKKMTKQYTGQRVFGKVLGEYDKIKATLKVESFTPQVYDPLKRFFPIQRIRQ